MAGPKTPGGFVQDGPPQGGYAPVKWRRNLPGGGMSSLALAATCGLTFVVGMAQIISGNRQRRCVRGLRPRAACSRRCRFSQLSRSRFIFFTRDRALSLRAQGRTAGGERHPYVDRALPAG